MSKLNLVWLAVMATLSHIVNAEVFINPPAEVIRIAVSLEYKDFPTAADILTIARDESSFNPFASNKDSKGIMQVNFGSFNVFENMSQGVEILREYFLRTGSKVSAIQAYNIGIGNFLKGKFKDSGKQYLQLFNRRYKSYENYVEQYRSRLRNTINSTSDGIGDEAMVRLARRNVLAFNRRGYYGLHPCW